MAVLKELLAKVEYECIRGSMEQEVTDIVYDSRKVEKGCMFVCIPGAKADGHDYAKGAVEAGASVLLVEKEVEGYTVTVTREGITFVVTNTYGETIEDEETPLANKPPLPKTGQLWWPVPVLICAGLLLIIFGLLRRRGAFYETE